MLPPHLTRGWLESLLAIGLTMIVAITLLACSGTSSGSPAAVSPTPRSASERQAAAEAAVAGIRVSPHMTGSSFLATEAIADFGVGRRIGLVRVRIVDQLTLDIDVTSSTTIELMGPPDLCLVGPYAAPDDAGLSDRCWGEPDLGPALIGAMGDQASDAYLLSPDRPITLNVRLDRGHVRCDYPPGTWQLAVTLEPRIDGQPVEPIALPPARFEVPPSTDEPLRLELFDTRYCGLASTVYVEQGEPPILEGN